MSPQAQRYVCTNFCLFLDEEIQHTRTWYPARAPVCWTLHCCAHIQTASCAMHLDLSACATMLGCIRKSFQNVECELELVYRGLGKPRTDADLVLARCAVWNDRDNLGVDSCKGVPRMLGRHVFGGGMESRRRDVWGSWSRYVCCATRFSCVLLAALSLNCFL